MSDPLAYFVTFTTYGARLHGDADGSWYRRTAPNTPAYLPEDARLNEAERSLMAARAFVLSTSARAVVEEAVREVCAHRGWSLLAVNVRSNHVHVLCCGPGAIDRFMQSLKSWATRRLREAGFATASDRIWARHGSTRYVWSQAELERVWNYVVLGQDGGERHGNDRESQARP